VSLYFGQFVVAEFLMGMSVKITGEILLTTAADRRRRTGVVQGIVVKKNEHFLFDQFFSLAKDS
jgi:hypothetical protein